MVNRARYRQNVWKANTRRDRATATSQSVSINRRVFCCVGTSVHECDSFVFLFCFTLAEARALSFFSRTGSAFFLMAMVPHRNEPNTVPRVQEGKNRTHRGKTRLQHFEITKRIKLCLLITSRCKLRKKFRSVALSLSPHKRDAPQARVHFRYVALTRVRTTGTATATS